MLQIHQRVKIDHANLLHLLETKQKNLKKTLLGDVLLLFIKMFTCSTSTALKMEDDC